MDATRLSAQHAARVGVVDPCLTVIHIARAARCQRDSSFLTCLEQAQAGHPDREKHGQTGPARRIGRDQRERQERSRDQRCNAQHSALADFTPSDVGQRCTTSQAHLLS